MAGSHTKAVNKYNSANYDSLRIVVPKGQKDKIKAHAEKRGELPGAGQTDPDTESKRAALLEKLQGVSAGDDSKE